MSYNFVFAGIVVGFFVLQAILSKNAKSQFIRSIPAGLLAVGLLFCLMTYLGAFGTYSESVIAENQEFAKVAVMHVMTGLAGCLAGAWFSRAKQSRKRGVSPKRK